MSTITHKFTHPGPAGRVPSKGSLICTPSSRRELPDETVLPEGFIVPLAADGTVSFIADDSPADGTWWWTFVEDMSRGRTRHCRVNGDADYAALEEVDPSSGNPKPPLPPVWKGYIDAAIAAAQAALQALFYTKGQSDGRYATTAQGGKADTAVQPAEVYAKAASDARYATTAQGGKADTAVQPADVYAKAASDARYARYATTAQGGKADTAVQPTAAGKAQLAIVENSKLWPFRAALGKRDTRLVNVGILGASSTEGAFVGNFDRTLGQQLVKLLRNRYPTAGLTGGGRGFIGIPTKELFTSAQYVANMWPQAFTGGLFDPPAAGAASAFDLGAKHMCWYSNIPGNKYVHTLAAAVTSYEVHHAKGASGAATTGYHKADAGSSNVFATGPAAGLGKEIGGAANATIEVGVNAAGYLITTGIREYAGDEAKGIQVHNFGHSGMKIADWQDGYAVPNSWREHLASFNLDLLILHDLGANDAFSGMTPAQVKAALVAFIAILRAGGITCPIVVSALFDPSGGAALGTPWSNYATSMREIADADATIVFVDHSVRMPSTAVTDTLGLFSTVDHVHARADGAINKWQASTYDAILAAA